MLDPVTDRHQNDIVTGKQNDLNPWSSAGNHVVTQNICQQDGDFFFFHRWEEGRYNVCTEPETMLNEDHEQISWPACNHLVDTPERSISPPLWVALLFMSAPDKRARPQGLMNPHEVEQNFLRPWPQMAIRLLLLSAELTNLPSKNEQYDGKIVLPHQRSEVQTGAHGPVVTLLPKRESQQDVRGLFLNCF